MLDGVGWEFVPWFVVYAPSPSIDASATTEMEMPMVSFVYISAPAPASGADVDTATAGHLLALGLQQFRVEPRRRLFMVSVVPFFSFFPPLCVAQLLPSAAGGSAEGTASHRVAREGEEDSATWLTASLPWLAARRG